MKKNKVSNKQKRDKEKKIKTKHKADKGNGGRKEIS